MPLRKVLILGGTREAARLAADLVAGGEWDVTTSLAGRTREPAPLAGHVRIGSFGGVEGLAAYLSENGVDRVIDATHPFARSISANAVRACLLAGIPLDIRTRAPWQKAPGDLWIEVDSLTAAAAALPRNARVFLALGRQYLDAFAIRSDCHFVIRMVEPPKEPLAFARFEVIAARPAEDRESEAELLRAHAITHLVARNSGGDGSYAKIAAARDLGLPVVMISRDGDQSS